MHLTLLFTPFLFLETTYNEDPCSVKALKQERNNRSAVTNIWGGGRFVKLIKKKRRGDTFVLETLG